jgi:putative hydrolase of the HAD superfamily
MFMADQGWGSTHKLQVIAFDLSDTIIAWNDAFDEAFKEAVDEWMGRWSEEEDKELVVKRVLHRYKVERRQKKGRIACIKSALSLLPITADRKTVMHLSKRIEQLQPDHANWMDGAETAIREMSQRYRIALITNLDKTRALTIYHRLHMNRYVKETDLYTPPSPNRKKPGTAFYKNVTTKLGIPAQQCVMIGNSWKQDVAGALNAGWRAVWIRKKSRRASFRRLPDGRKVPTIPTVHSLPKLFP